MRVPLACATALLALSLVPAASSQTGSDDDGCLSRAPCPLTVDLDANGIWIVGNVVVDRHNTSMDVTVGDWYFLYVDHMDIDNDTGPSRTVSIEGLENAQVTVAHNDFAKSEGFQFATKGSFTLTEQPSGDEFTIRVVDEDVSSSAPDGDADVDPEGSPGLGVAAMAAVVVAVALVLRRR